MAQEIVTMAMMAAAICCVLAVYIVLSSFELADLGTYVLLGVGVMVIVGYVTFRVTAAWIGKPLPEVMG